MSDDALLIDLCSICNTAKFKYRCPGCSARTCSLPCYKRHQKWAQCNGKRDPTKFVKKSELATPAGIDHDFNFLTGIERSLETAAKQMQGRGLGNIPDPRRDAKARPPSEQNFAAAGVTVVRAPTGLSRQKDNKTTYNKSKNIVWTVEWIHEDTTRILTQSSSAAPILQSQPFEKGTKRKRKRIIDQSVSVPASSSQNVSSSFKDGEQVSMDTPEHEQPESPIASGLGPGSANSGTVSTTKDTKDGGIEAGGHCDGGDHVPSPESQPFSPQYSFYLVKPRTSSNRIVLIRLESLVTLGECLRGRTLLEFPTIYVYPSTSSPPSDRFMLDAEYLQQEGAEQKELQDLLKHVSPEALRALQEEHVNDDDDAVGEAIDSGKIVNVLQQDIGAGI